MGDTAVGRGPAGMGIAEGDVAWDRRYLQLEPPAGVHTFAEFGQADEDALLSPVAVTEPFRILSDEGVAVALKIARELEKLAVGDARSKRMRGCTYQLPASTACTATLTCCRSWPRLPRPTCASTRSGITRCSSTSPLRNSAVM